MKLTSLARLRFAPPLPFGVQPYLARRYAFHVHEMVVASTGPPRSMGHVANRTRGATPSPEHGIILASHGSSVRFRGAPHVAVSFGFKTISAAVVGLGTPFS